MDWSPSWAVYRLSRHETQKGAIATNQGYKRKSGWKKEEFLKFMFWRNKLKAVVLFFFFLSCIFLLLPKYKLYCVANRVFLFPLINAKQMCRSLKRKRTKGRRVRIKVNSRLHNIYQADGKRQAGSWKQDLMTRNGDKKVHSSWVLWYGL